MKWFLLSIVNILLLGCKGEVENTVSSLFYKNIDYKNNVFQIYKDSIGAVSQVLPSIKILTYVDSSLCSKCLANRMYTASKYIQSLKNDSLIYIFILQPRPIDDIQDIADYLYDDHIVAFYDENESFLKNNAIDKISSLYTTFLLDSTDRIVLIGDPLGSKELRTLYDARIREL